MALLPHWNKILFDQTKQKFSINPIKFSDLNTIFFNNSCPLFFQFIEKCFESEGKEFLKYYPNLQKLFFNIKEILPIRLPILEKSAKNKKISLKRKQVALIFLLSFFGCLQANKINRFHVWNRLIKNTTKELEFGRCFLNYLTTIGKWLKQNNPILEDDIIYLRNNIQDKSIYSSEEVDLCEIQFHEKDSMFNGKESYCVDFANKYIGGGVLNAGCVQEEILFAKEPEATVAMFFMEVMDDNDAIGIFNTIEYSRTSGYVDKFKFEGTAITDDLLKIKKHRLIAIDALININYIRKYQKFQNQNYQNYFDQNNAYFRNDQFLNIKNNNFTFYQNTNFPYNLNKAYNPFIQIINKNQFNQKDIIRDIHKAYVGFNLINLYGNNIEKTIATGNWGCGAFGGNHELKFIQQWIAASFAGVKRLDYYTFSHNKMQNAITFYESVKNKYQKADNLYRAIVNNNFKDDKIIVNLL